MKIQEAIAMSTHVMNIVKEKTDVEFVRLSLEEIEVFPDGEFVGLPVLLYTFDDVDNMERHTLNLPFGFDAVLGNAIDQVNYTKGQMEEKLAV